MDVGNWLRSIAAMWSPSSGTFDVRLAHNGVPVALAKPCVDDLASAGGTMRWRWHVLGNEVVADEGGALGSALFWTHTTMRTPSPALLHKIAKARAAAPSELPLVRRCAHVVLAWAIESSEQEATVAGLKAAHGSNWSLITALQLLSGRRGLFAVERSDPHERAMLYHAHLLAKACCSRADLGAVNMPTLKEVEELRRLAVEQAPEN